MAIRERDNGANALLRRMRKEATVKVGIIGSKAAEATITGDTVVEIATIHQFGLGVEARPFITQPVDQNESQIKRGLRRQAEQIARGRMTVEQALDRVGLFVVGLMQDAISGRQYKANKPSTVRRKGSSTPLVNTGQLRSSITHETSVEQRRGR